MSHGNWILVAVVALVGTAHVRTARAGVPECGGVRLEDAGGCEVKGSAQCTGGCSQLGIYKKACATKLHTRCREECTLSPMPTCTDDCTETCQQRCDAGEDIKCIHNCFRECSGSCTLSCEGAEDVDTCMASCEATCDGECDVQCAPLVSGSCYEHCIECCGGSCGAQANMECQTSCQEVEFEECEHEFRVECDASCEVDGALFCDGEYVLSGDQMPGCVEALLERGIDAHAEAAVKVGNRTLEELDQLGDDAANATGNGKASLGCHVGALDPGRSTERGGWMIAFLLPLGALALRRNG
ncbi:MAG: hypothetical protein OXU20_29725 [Myxococcales bacterium]|nr:hypothetical protein [Myxococcales bacterium]MDD9968362.1 hypothetical protein [Myxococcales bacterium]